MKECKYRILKQGWAEIMKINIVSKSHEILAIRIDLKTKRAEISHESDDSDGNPTFIIVPPDEVADKVSEENFITEIILTEHLDYSLFSRDTYKSFIDVCLIHHSVIGK